VSDATRRYPWCDYCRCVYRRGMFSHFACRIKRHEPYAVAAVNWISVCMIALAAVIAVAATGFKLGAR